MTRRPDRGLPHLGFVGQKTFTVTFRNNNGYAYACEPHWQVMNGSFFVTDAPPPPPPPPPPPHRRQGRLQKRLRVR